MKKALIKVHVAVLLAGFTGPLGRLIHLGEGVLVWYRLLFTSVTMLAIFLIRGELARMPARDFFRHAFVGLLIAIHWVLFYGSIKYANVSIALVCFSSTSLFTALMEPLFMKTRFDSREIWLSLLAIGGIYIVFRFNSNFHLGILLGLGAAVFAAYFTILNKKLVGVYSAPTVCTYELSCGLVCLTLLMPLYLHIEPQQKLLPGGTDLIYLLFLSWLCTVVAWTLAISALKKVSSFTMNLSLCLEPVYGIAMAFLLFGENRQFGGWFYAGFGLIMLSVVLQTWRILGQEKQRKKTFASGSQVLTA